MAVRLRMKRMGRRHRPFYRICAVDRRAARDGKVIEYLGHYDPMVKETDARAVLNGERIDYWLGVGAQPSDRVSVLIKKYGTNGTHAEQQKEAMARLVANRPTAPPPVAIPKPKAEEPEAPAAEEGEAAPEAAAEDAPAEAAASEPASEDAGGDTPAPEATADGGSEEKSE